MIPEVHACSGYLAITAPNGAYRDNAGALAQDHIQRLARYAGFSVRLGVVVRFADHGPVVAVGWLLR
jgi:hypothetical protein